MCAAGPQPAKRKRTPLLARPQASAADTHAARQAPRQDTHAWGTENRPPVPLSADAALYGDWRDLVPTTPLYLPENVNVFLVVD